MRGNASCDALRHALRADAERPGQHSHAERGNDQQRGSDQKHLLARLRMELEEHPRAGAWAVDQRHAGQGHSPVAATDAGAQGSGDDRASHHPPTGLKDDARSHAMRGNASCDALRHALRADAERPGQHSHAERGNDQQRGSDQKEGPFSHSWFIVSVSPKYSNNHAMAGDSLFCAHATHEGLAGNGRLNCSATNSPRSIHGNT